MSRFLRFSILCVVTLGIVGNTYAGRSSGPGTKTDIAPARTTINYYDRFRGGEDTVIRVVGDGSSDLDLYVYDENGKLIAKDDDATDTCIVRFTPRWSGLFHIRVVNRGNEANLYTIETN